MMSESEEVAAAEALNEVEESLSVLKDRFMTLTAAIAGILEMDLDHAG